MVLSSFAIISQEKRVGWLLYSRCPRCQVALCSLSLPGGSVGRDAGYHCDISWSYLLYIKIKCENSIFVNSVKK